MEWKIYPIKEDFQPDVYPDIPLPLKKSLYRRGIRTKDEVLRFFQPELKNLMSPEMLPNISSAAEIIIEAVRLKKPVLIWGDEDVDGIAGTMIIYRTLKKLDANVKFYIPDRKKEGVGLNFNGIKNAVKEGIQLLITVDCGSSNNDEVKYAQESGIDIVITDHHEVPEKHPSTPFFINPKIDDYPFSELSGAVVAFKLSYVIIRRMVGLSLSEWLSIMPEIIVYSSLSVLSDRVPLLNDNRILLVEGIKYFSYVKQPGLFIVSQFTNNMEKFYEVISYLQSGKEGILEQFFLERDKDKATELFHRMEIRHRQWIENARNIYNRISPEVERDGYVSFVKGVDPEFLGYCASRLKDFSGKPVILIGERNGEYIGEGRAPRDFDLIRTFELFSGDMIKYGGHKAAGGFTIKKDALENFLFRIREIIMSYIPKGEKFVDSEIKSDDLNKKFIETLSKFPPYGEGNPEPVFLLKDTSIQRFGNDMFIDNNGLKLFIEPPVFIEEGKPVNLIFSIKDNGKIKVKDWK